MDHNSDLYWIQLFVVWIGEELATLEMIGFSEPSLKGVFCIVWQAPTVTARLAADRRSLSSYVENVLEDHARQDRRPEIAHGRTRRAIGLHGRSHPCCIAPFRRLETLKGLTPYEYICKCWTYRLAQFDELQGGRTSRDLVFDPFPHLSQTATVYRDPSNRPKRAGTS
jgi:hypothetical protein